ncbi:hypothetical protein [Nocardia sp. NPDC004604]|uniref:hypothetical protein n=1 Tax=Nocardia sp. NPDC004604 TaxID=3157013 RepID=UPI0033AFA87F
MVLDDNHQNTIEALSKLSQDVAVLPDKLKIVAETFEDSDGKFGKQMDRLRAEIAEAEGQKGARRSATGSTRTPSASTTRRSPTTD